MKKSGTPTMGGLMMIVALLVSIFMWGDVNPQIVIALTLFVGHGIIGFIDDYIKVVKKRNLGLTAKQKFLFQFIIAGMYIYYAETHAPSTTLWVPGVDMNIDLGWAYYVLVFLLLVGTTNAVNLTDGLDGLASFVTLPVALVYAVIAFLYGLQSLSAFAMGVAAVCLGFLLFNRHPAQVFMGDTGSLALGGAIAALALLTHTELLLVFLAVYMWQRLLPSLSRCFTSA